MCNTAQKYGNNIVRYLNWFVKSNCKLEFLDLIVLYECVDKI